MNGKWSAIIDSGVASVFASSIGALLITAVFTACCRGEILDGGTFFHGDYALTIDDKTIDKQPHWQPSDGNPPLAPRDALTAADQAFAKVFDQQKFPGWKAKVTEFMLWKIGTSVWCWRVTYTVSWQGYDFPDDPFDLPISVLMTGETLTPRLEKADRSCRPELLQRRAEAQLRVIGELFEEPLYQPPPAKPTEWKFGGHLNQGLGVATLTPEMLSAAPKWKLEDRYPPLSMDRAWQAATAVQQEHFRESESSQVEMDAVYLEQLRDDEWIWVFHYELRPRFGGSTGRPFMLNVAVLMDGEAIEPKLIESKP